MGSTDFKFGVPKEDLKLYLLFVPDKECHNINV